MCPVGCALRTHKLTDKTQVFHEKTQRLDVQKLVLFGGNPLLRKREHRRL